MHKSKRHKFKESMDEVNHKLTRKIHTMHDIGSSHSSSQEITSKE